MSVLAFTTVVNSLGEASMNQSRLGRLVETWIWVLAGSLDFGILDTRSGDTRMRTMLLACSLTCIGRRRPFSQEERLPWDGLSGFSTLSYLILLLLVPSLNLPLLTLAVSSCCLLSIQM